jgi:murein DD-endopeptidase MepM/ murein hydrolase activator NlpD
MLKFLLCFFFSVLAIAIVPPTTEALTQAYKITDEIPLVGSPEGAGYFLTKEITINISESMPFVYLSLRPDGTGNTWAEDAFEISVLRSDGSTSNLRHHYRRDCRLTSQVFELEPYEIGGLNFYEGENKVTIRLASSCGFYRGSTSFYLVNTDTPPQPPSPFLDLPWDYESKGLTFNEAALSINSYFDHEYPLLSSGLSEPAAALGSIVNYNGLPRTDDPYTKHDGYDYGKQAKANYGDSQLAAAAGCASYRYSKAGGHMIFIDHGNNYQTRYLHLKEDELITKNSSPCVNVSKRQQIGKIGASGNVKPSGEGGAHIHFMVVEDKDRDGNFDNNIPDGVTDPFGWKPNPLTDPWPNYMFLQNGKRKYGNKSYYLWEKRIDSLSTDLVFEETQFKMGKYTLDFPTETTEQGLYFNLEPLPNAKPTNVLSSIGSILSVTARDVFGSFVKNFENYFSVKINFDLFDISKYKPHSLSIYSSDDGVNWTKETTTIDFDQKIAESRVNHLSYFALMGEKIDSQSPITTASLSGTLTDPGKFSSEVTINISAHDEGELGIDYTLYRINFGDWKDYTSFFKVSKESFYRIYYYSADNDENIEEIKTLDFYIDKTPITPSDTDGDGFPNDLESYLGTNSSSDCSSSATENDEETDGFPLDLNDDKIIDQLDVDTFKPILNSRRGQAKFSQRHDLNQDGIINTRDIGKFVPKLDTLCGPLD